MAIRTKFGNEVMIVGRAGADTVKVRRIEDGKEYDVALGYLVADGGAEEIREALGEDI